MQKPATIYDTIAIDLEWKERLIDEFSQPYFTQLKSKLQQEKAEGKIIYPSGKNIFSAYNLTPFSAVKVIIIGQDPYHGFGQAHGLSFSVPHGIKIPPSLGNIYKELKADIGIEPPQHGNLQAWAKQGVLLLNALLTVRANEPASHHKIGWQQFTDATIALINAQKINCVFFLWGKFAQEKAAMIDTTKHLVLMAAHPSPFSSDKGFFGCKHFSAANAYLIAHRKTAIDWQLQNE